MLVLSPKKYIYPIVSIIVQIFLKNPKQSLLLTHYYLYQLCFQKNLRDRSREKVKGAAFGPENTPFTKFLRKYFWTPASSRKGSIKSGVCPLFHSSIFPSALPTVRAFSWNHISSFF